METATIEQTEWLPAKPVQVYDAFVNARKHTEFTGAGATCEPVVVEHSPRGTVISRVRTSNWNSA